MTYSMVLYVHVAFREEAIPACGSPGLVLEAILACLRLPPGRKNARPAAPPIQLLMVQFAGSPSLPQRQHSVTNLFMYRSIWANALRTYKDNPARHVLKTDNFLKYLGNLTRQCTIKLARSYSYDPVF